MTTTEGVNKVNSQASSQSDDPGIDGFPPQRHAGQVGYGPNYKPVPTIQEKITGLKEELKGKIKHDPELVRHGHDIRSGTSNGEENEPNPFQSAKDSDNSPGSSSDINTPHKDSSVQESNGKSPKDQAATAALEGTKDADIQKGGKLESVEGGR